MTLLRIALLVFLVPASALAQEITDLYIANQGNFSDRNGSVTWYDVGTGQITDIPMNTLVQSVSRFDDFLLVASNTSDAVDVINRSTHQRYSQIAGIASPRYIVTSSEGNGFVTNLYSGTVTMLDVYGHRVLANIGVGSNPEDLAIVGDRVYVANSGFGADSTVTVLETASGNVLETIIVKCDGPRHLEADEEDELWVICTGKTVYSPDFTQIIERTNAEVVVLDGSTGTEISRMVLDRQVGAAGLGQDTHYSPYSQELFVISGQDILVFDTATNSLLETFTAPPTSTADPQPGIGGLAYDSANRMLYASRIVGYTVAGMVQVISRDDLTEIGSFSVGIAPTQIAMVRQPSTTASESPVEPGDFQWDAVWPNPFRSTTNLAYRVTEHGPVSLAIYDVMGRELARPAEGIHSPGTYSITWSASGLAPGVYLARLTGPHRVAVRSLVVVR